MDDNVEATAIVENIKADPNGRLQVTVSPGTRNESGSSYLGILRFDWAIPPQRPAFFSDLSVGETALEFLLIGTAAARYRLEQSSDLSHWMELSRVTLTNGFADVQSPRSGSREFFRAIRLPN